MQSTEEATTNNDQEKLRKENEELVNGLDLDGMFKQAEAEKAETQAKKPVIEKKAAVAKKPAAKPATKETKKKQAVKEHKNDKAAIQLSKAEELIVSSNKAAVKQVKENKEIKEATEPTKECPKCPTCP